MITTRSFLPSNDIVPNSRDDVSILMNENESRGAQHMWWTTLLLQPANLPATHRIRCDSLRTSMSEIRGMEGGEAARE